MPKKVLEEAEEVLCCDDCETPLLPIIHLACTPKGMKKLEALIDKCKGKIIDYKSVFNEGRELCTGSGQYCPECKEDNLLGDAHTSFFNTCPHCKCKLNKKKESETKAQCPRCKKFFKTTDNY